MYSTLERPNWFSLSSNIGTPCSISLCLIKGMLIQLAAAMATKGISLPIRAGTLYSLKMMMIITSSRTKTYRSNDLIECECCCSGHGSRC